MGTGQLIVIEGLDGSGKATQTAKLAQWYADRNLPARKVAFPDYDSDSSALVRMYLAGDIGPADSVGAYAASSFYAVDRYASYHKNWKKDYQSGYTILADRYTTSNAAHQMSKLPKGEWDEYLRWLEDFEYAKLGLPKPDRVLYLDMHPDTSRALILTRAGGDPDKIDIHERDLAYLLRCRTAALYAADALGWTVIGCCDTAQPRPVDDIFSDLLHELQP